MGILICLYSYSILLGLNLEPIFIYKYFDCTNCTLYHNVDFAHTVTTEGSMVAHLVLFCAYGLPLLCTWEYFLAYTCTGYPYVYGCHIHIAMHICTYMGNFACPVYS